MGWSVDDVMPRRDGPENLPIEAKTWVSAIEARVGFWPLKDVDEFYRSLTTEI